MLKTFKIENSNNYWTCEVEIDEELIITREGYPDITTLESMKEMILFWSGGAARLNCSDNDVIKTFLQQLAREVYIILVEYNWNVLGVINEFKNREGWCIMDGSQGIKITYVDDLEIDYEEFEVEEIKK